MSWKYWSFLRKYSQTVDYARKVGTGRKQKISQEIQRKISEN